MVQSLMVFSSRIRASASKFVIALEIPAQIRKSLVNLILRADWRKRKFCDAILKKEAAPHLSDRRAGESFACSESLPCVLASFPAPNNLHMKATSVTPGAKERLLWAA